MQVKHVTGKILLRQKEAHSILDNFYFHALEFTWRHNHCKGENKKSSTTQNGYSSITPIIVQNEINQILNREFANLKIKYAVFWYI